jgi:hypothetical protein
MLLLQAVLYAGLSTTAPVASTPGQNITTVPADQRFGPTTISSLVVGVFGTLFGLLSLVPFWLLLRKMVVAVFSSFRITAEIL